MPLLISLDSCSLSVRHSFVFDSVFSRDEATLCEGKHVCRSDRWSVSRSVPIFFLFSGVCRVYGIVDRSIDQGKRATKGYSQESVLRIQNVFEEDRGATYGDEGGVPSKLPKKEDITKIKNRWSLFGVLFGLLSKG